MHFQANLARPLPPRYDHAGERARYDRQQAARDGHAGNAAAPPFNIILPPPNITGQLHLGHAYEHALIDSHVRRARMRGYDTRWTPGLDHAGIATQSLIERQLRAEGTTRAELGRDAFLARCWQWKDQTETQILDQMRAIGASCDWDRLRFTMDPHASAATAELFCRLWDAGLIYRSDRENPWCPTCATALSDIELDHPAPGALSGAATCSRCATPTELRPTAQWYLATSELAGGASQALLGGELTIQPPELAPKRLGWADSMHDWCLSRQLWWGHRIPLWHGPDGQIRAVRPGQTPPEGWRQGPDTLDTWFSSGLWPLTTLGWPDIDAESLACWWPTTLLIAGSDLLFFWAMRMVMLCRWASGTTPFRTLAFHGLIRDRHGRKLSKSTGNISDPRKLIEQWGADTLRLALLSASRPAGDLSFDAASLKGARATLNKLHSIAALAQRDGGAELNDDLDAGAEPSGADADSWIAHRLADCQSRVDAAFEVHDLAGACAALRSFTHDELSDRWIEAAKLRLRSPGRDGDRARATLRDTLDTLLGLWHPIIPFHSDELAEHLGMSLRETSRWPGPSRQVPADGRGHRGRSRPGRRTPSSPILTP